MIIAELKADHAYRSVHLTEVLEGRIADVVNHEWFRGAERIGPKWISRDVSYYVSPDGDQCCNSGQTDATKDGEGALPIGDFPLFWGITQGVLAKRSFNVLREILDPYVEFLPLSSKQGEFTAFKVLNYLDALDLDKSVIDWFPQTKTNDVRQRIARSIKTFIPKTSVLADECIFCIPQMPAGTHIFVTERLIHTVKANGLTGFNFDVVWPHNDERKAFLERHRRKRQNNK